MTTSRSSSRLRSSTTKESALSRVQASSSSTAGTMRTPLMARLRWHIPALQRSCETTSNCQGPERLAGEKSSGHWLGLTGSFRGRPDAAPFPSTLSFARPLPSLSGPPFPSFVSFRGRRSEPSRARCPHPVTAPSPCETLILAADAEGGDSLRLSTWVANRAFSDLADHDVCPTCRARALAAPLHCTSCSARGPAALGPATSHIVLGGASDRRSASNRTLWWHLSACNNANTSPCHTRHAPQNAPQSESLHTHAHMRARAFYCRLTHDADALAFAFATYAADGAIDANAHVPAPPPTV